MNSNKLAENISNTDITYTEMLRLTGKYEPLTPKRFLTLKQEMKDNINSELSLIFAKVGNFEQALVDMKSSKALSDLYELYISQLELAEQETDRREYDIDLNPDMNSVPTILSNLRRAIFGKIDNTPLCYRFTPTIFKLKTQILISYCERYEKPSQQ
jgi:hypothetical protein